MTGEGTIIKGALATELGVDMGYPSQIAEITILGHNLAANPEIMLEIMEKAKAQSTLLGMSTSTNSAILYLSEEKNIDQLFNETHKTILKHEEALAMAVKKGLVFLKISGVGLEETHGIIGTLSETLSQNSINISGILTIASSILVFVDWNERENALRLIKHALRSKET
ncbi:TPA: hypothetical protein HA273_00105 [Candidatus Bathyarchaeota archaeon]|nr:hypothetical protein [Candidatus Bathyarchaeota archaeon]